MCEKVIASTMYGELDLEKMFKRELAELINKYCIENVSNTPDFIIADYLCACLDTFHSNVNMRDRWHGNKSMNFHGNEIDIEG